MPGKRLLSVITGFLLLFVVYHFPEFFSAFWIMAAFKTGFLVLAYILARMQGWKGLGGYGLGLNRKWIMDLLKGVFIGLLFFALAVMAAVFLGYAQFVEIDSTATILNQLPLLLLMTAIPSVTEDILTRGYLYAHFKRMKPIHWIVFSSIIYVLNHIWRLNDGAAVLTYLFLLGMVLATAVWISQSLWLAFGIHWGGNIAFEFSNSFVHTKNLVAHNGSTWLLAGSWALVFFLLLIFRKRSLRPVEGQEKTMTV